MTTKNDKDDNAKIENTDINTNSDSDSDSDKTRNIAEKLKTLGTKPSNEPASEIKARKITPLLITILFAVPVAGIIAYINMPDSINQLFSSAGDSSTTVTNQDNYIADNIQPNKPAYPTADQWNRQQNEPEWVSQQRAESENRRAEFQKRNADNYANNLRSSQPPEPPQWVKDRQAEMQREMAMYQQQNNYPGNMGYNWSPEPPAYMKHPGINSYQQTNQPMINNQAQPYHNQSPVNAYPQTQNQFNNPYNYPANPYYYNAPYYYGQGPGYAPYGWQGYR